MKCLIPFFCLSLAYGSDDLNLADPLVQEQVRFAAGVESVLAKISTATTKLTLNPLILQHAKALNLLPSLSKELQQDSLRVQYDSVNRLISVQNKTPINICFIKSVPGSEPRELKLSLGKDAILNLKIENTSYQKAHALKVLSISQSGTEFSMTFKNGTVSLINTPFSKLSINPVHVSFELNKMKFVHSLLDGKTQEIPCKNN